MFSLTSRTGTLSATEKGWKVRDIDIPDIQTINEKQRASGRPGSSYLGTTIGDRDNIAILFDFYFVDLSDYEKQKSEIMSAFNVGEMQLFVESRGNDMWLNVVKESLSFERVGFVKCKVNVELSTVGLPYFQTWVEEVFHVENQSSFLFVNPSHTTLDGRFTDTEIELFIENPDTVNRINIQLDQDLMSGTARVDWEYTGEPPNYILITDGSTFENGNEDAIEKTTMNVIDFLPGNNRINIYGVTNFSFTIYSRHYFF